MSDEELDRGPSATPIEQRIRWHRQFAAMPDLHCAKDQIVPLLEQLISQIKSGSVDSLDARPMAFGSEAKRPWREYVSPLKTLGLATNNRGTLKLTQNGDRYSESFDTSYLATLIADRVRLFAEVLELVIQQPLTVQEVNDRVVSDYELSWKTVTNARLRLTWLEALGLVEWLGDRKISATAKGRGISKDWIVVRPEALTVNEEEQAERIPDAPPEIAALLEELRAEPSRHSSRNTYNIWVPSPGTDPNKIENMQVAISAAVSPIAKNQLLDFIADRFGLRRSSVDSMMPFMRAGGFLQEVQRGVFVATGPAKAWLESRSEVNFIRILHANMRFVGELIEFSVAGASRADIYTEGTLYGLNKDKIRWIISFLINARLLIETSINSVKTTATGVDFVKDLPLAARPLTSEGSSSSNAITDPASPQPATTKPKTESHVSISEALRRTARDPGADGKASGVAFEEAIRDIFASIGFGARRIGGAGDTDVLVEWSDMSDEPRSAIIDAKSSASGRISHSNVSDVALDTHKDKHSADYVAIIGPGFSGDTIQTMAQKRSWALVTADELADVVVAANQLGLSPSEVGAIFDPVEGKSALNELIENRERELDISALVISRLHKELAEDEPLSARDISLIERVSSVEPTVHEIRKVFELFERLEVGVVRQVEDAADRRFSTYRLADARSAARRLRAIADAIERGLGGAK